MTRIGINGFGRIGRSVFRILSDRDDMEVVAINDLYENEQLAYLLKYDTLMRVFPKEVTWDEESLTVDGKRIEMTAEKDPSQIPWGKFGADIVIESTGVHTKKEALAKHLEGGAKKVILTVPPKDEIDAMIVVGVNDDTLKPEHKLVSNASCTTNCLAPIAKVLHERFGIEEGFITTVHAYTNDQRLADVPHKDLRRSRAAPVVVGMMFCAAARLRDRPSVEQVNAAVRESAEGPLAEIIEYSEVPLVSSDIIGNPHSSIFDALSTMSTGDGYVKVVAWYDNEWGYSNRVVDLIDRLVAVGGM